MMAFALYADNSDVVCANFHLDNLWIRFREYKLKTNPRLIKFLPEECKMYKSKDLITNNSHSLSHISYIEYPNFSINVPNVFKSFFLKLLFSSYHQYEVFYEYKREKKLFGMLKIAMEYVARKIIFR